MSWTGTPEEDPRVFGFGAAQSLPALEVLISQTAAQSTYVRTIIHHTGLGTTMVLDVDDPLELERQERWPA